MAKQVIIQLVDDIDGSVIDADSGESIEFTVGGVEYSIDLNEENAAEFHRKLGYYIGHGTRVGGRKRKSTSTVSAAAVTTLSPTKTAAKRDPSQTRAIRQWAADAGYEISDRGRIPADIEAAFDAAH